MMYKVCTWGFIVVSEDKKRVTVSLPKDTLDLLDSLAKKNGLTRSGVINIMTRKFGDLGKLI